MSLIRKNYIHVEMSYSYNTICKILLTFPLNAWKRERDRNHRDLESDPKNITSTFMDKLITLLLRSFRVCKVPTASSPFYIQSTSIVEGMTNHPI